MKLSNLPWWAKIFFKLGLATVPLPYERVRSALTGYRGHMQDKSYAEKIFQEYITDYQKFFSGKKGGTLLELGPGGSLLSGILGRVWGFSQCILVDVGDFACRDQDLYLEMVQRLDVDDRKRFEKKLHASGCVIEAFREIDVFYLTDGIFSLSQLAENSISFCFSNAVLEHVRQGEFSSTLKELYRIHEPGSIGSHQVDYKDHLSRSLNNLRFSSKIWESRFFPNSGFYTNRLRHSDVITAFNRAGFFITKNDTVCWKTFPLSRKKMADEFQKYSNEQLNISGGRIVLKKPAE